MSPTLALASLFLFAAVTLGGCEGSPPAGDTPAASSRRPIEEVLAEKTPEWMSWEGVVGTAQSVLDDGRPCLVVYLAYESEDVRRRLPEAVEGYPVVIEVTGEFHAMPDSGAR